MEVVECGFLYFEGSAGCRVTGSPKLGQPAFKLQRARPFFCSLPRIALRHCLPKPSCHIVTRSPPPLSQTVNMKSLLLAAALVLMMKPVNLVEIDNHLIGDPVVVCGDTMVSLTFTTEKPFTGRIYVKGLADDDRCSRNFASNADQNKLQMVVPTGDCGMLRQRVAGQLEGLMFSLIIVVSFHGTFVTKVDRAYRCMCFFQNIKEVTNFLDISAIDTTPLLDTAKMPTCTYTLHSGSQDGPLVRYGKVGEKIFHVYECDDDAQGFLVHSCWANDGRGARFDFHDIDGCAVDPIIMGDIRYADNLRKAWVETHGFKFSDTSVLNFQCVLELCKKSQGECDGFTPPNCGRGKRSISAKLFNDDRAQSYLTDASFDVVTSMDVLNAFDDDLDLALPPPELFGDNSAMLNGKDGQTCISSMSFGIILSLIAVTFLTAVVTSVLLFLRLRPPVIKFA